MRFIRTALTVTALGVAMLTMAGPAMADDTKPAAAPRQVSATAKPSPVPAPAQSSRPAPAPVPAEAGPAPAQDIPRGAPETGGGPGGSPLVPLGGALLATGAGMGVLVMRRRAGTRA
ncbi:hypothetical protein [Streptosporangium subroseum]|uniref:hypothetical protein n=1 Tax=Streptosporangium subroseum TaxID=106412 RepID=UPI00308CDE87|nr:hypothetical protein OHB15_39920 [Streptosporangium subroseum]